MIKAFLSTTLLALLLQHGHCQELAKGLSFEVASITPCKPDTPAPPGEHAGMVQFVYPGGRFNATATTVKYLMEWAYGIQGAQHSGGPSWLETDRYDIVAKSEGNATEDQMKLMTQKLLADRFQLKFHRESKELSVFVVTAGNSPKLFPPKADETHAIRISPLAGSDPKVPSYHVVATRFSLAQLDDTFARQLGHVIIDQTGLKGDFDFTFDLTPDEERPNPLDPAHIMTAMRQQLGLTLKSQKAPVDIMVIDGAQRVTAGNE